MPTVLNATTIAATSTNQNLLTGSAFEYARVRQAMSAALLASASGVVANIQAGPNIVAEAFPVGIQATGYPIVPDQFYFNEVVEPGDRIVIRAQNTSGAPITVSWVVQLSGRG